MHICFLRHRVCVYECPHANKAYLRICIVKANAIPPHHYHKACATGFIAGAIDICVDWMIDVRLGICTTNPFLSRKLCCEVENAGKMLEVLRWRGRQADR